MVLGPVNRADVGERRLVRLALIQILIQGADGDGRGSRKGGPCYGQSPEHANKESEGLELRSRPSGFVLAPHREQPLLSLIVLA